MSLTRAPQIVMAASDVNDLEASTLEGTNEEASTDPGELGQEVATSSSTTSASASGGGTGMSSLEAASRYPRIAS